MLYARGDKFVERLFRRASRGDDEYYYGVQDREEYDEYEEDEFV